MNIKNLDFKTAGFWPDRVKKIAYAVAFLLILVLGWFLAISSKNTELKNLEKQEATLRDEYATVQAKANSLNYLRQELAQIKDLLTTLISQLPNKNEIPELVVNVSQAAISNGLQVDLFEPQEETKKEFYAEKRINVDLKGDYHKLGAFFSDVAMQPRLISVVVEDMKMTVIPPKKDAKKDGEETNMELIVAKDPILDFQGSVRTYRYLSDDEEAEIAKAKKEAEAKDKKKKKKTSETKEEK